MHIQSHSKGFPFPFFENWKKYLDFGKKGPGYVDLLVKFSIQNVILKEYVGEETPKCFPARKKSGALDKMFIKVH